MKKSGIYGIVNTNDGRTYVGQAIDIWKRCGQHFASLKRGDHPNIRMQRAFIRDGAESFRFFIIAFCGLESLDDKESEWIAFHKVRYNICDIGCSRRGVTASDETRKKLSDAKKGKQPLHLMTKESRAKAAETHSKVWHLVHDSKQPESVIRKRTESQKARWAVTPKKKMSDIAKQRMSESAKNREIHGNTKITKDVVQEIRNSTMTGRALSKLFSISPSQVSRIRNNQSWIGAA